MKETLLHNKKKQSIIQKIVYLLLILLNQPKLFFSLTFHDLNYSTKLNIFYMKKNNT